MKKSLIALMAMSMLSIGVAQAAETNSVSNFFNKLESAEESTYNKLEASKQEAQAKQKQREEAKQQRQEALKKQQEEAKARQEARQKKLETKKQQWKDLLEIDNK